MEIREIFEDKIKIEPKVITIESLFNNPEKVEKTNYQPLYQRNYVWDDEKATYFIESILLGTEIPPLIFFRNADKSEVIDGRQRYETILRFINGEFKLKQNGLQKLNNIGIAGKTFKDLSSHLQDLFWDTKLRIIEFSFHSRKYIDDDMEDLVKKEIFKRYNSGITPLKSTDLDKAAYFDDDLNSFFKEKILADKIVLRNLTKLLHFDKSNNEKLLKKVRQLLVQHSIPIKYYAVKKDNIITKFFDLQFSNIDESEIENIYNSFIEKINLIERIYVVLAGKKTVYNRLITECLFWAFSILENEGIKLVDFSSELIEKLAEYVKLNIETFQLIRSSFYHEIYDRYRITSKFFSNEYDVDFNIYLHYNEDFKALNNVKITADDERISFDELRINKPEPSSTAIMDICRQMGRQRFLIRPPYQRDEVINTKKSSAIIESILLGIKLPPIFVYKRQDKVSEVLDGQQRLLSILAFINKSYLDENNKITYSAKNNFKLSLKGNILKNLDGKRFDNLSIEQKEKIKNFDLWIIEISYENNKDFEPIDLFIRLNNKPYPIKEDTFEMWNSSVSREIITNIKIIHNNHSGWFYIRKNNSRMENENIYTALAYFQFRWNKGLKSVNFVSKDVDIYKVFNKIMFRVKSKNEITRVLEDSNFKNDFIEAANDFEFHFIRKVKLLLSDEEDSTIATLNKNLDEIFIVENGRRTQQAFYALWYFLYDIPIESLAINRLSVRQSLKFLFKTMTGVESKLIFDKYVTEFKQQFNSEKLSIATTNFENFALLGEIATFSPGLALAEKTRSNSNGENYPFLKSADLYTFVLNKNDFTYLDENTPFSSKDFFNARNKILIKKLTHSGSKLNVAFFDAPLAFSPNYIGVLVNRYGFHPKYILCILASKYTYSLFSGQFRNSSVNNKSLSINDLKSLKIPQLIIELQQPFIILADYLMEKSIDLEAILFFERIIDAMVYELYIPSIIRGNGANVIEHLKDLQKLGDDADENRVIIENNYFRLSSSMHPISSALLKLLNIAEVNQIEGRL